MNPHRPSDTEITEWALAAGDGDRSALERFVHATQPIVWRFVAHLAGAGAADDLTQETYLRALGSLARFEARCPAKNWLLSIARRVVIDQIRTACTRPRLAHLPDWQEATERVRPIGTHALDEAVVLGELVNSLEQERREAFLLTQTFGLSYADAAEICGCPVGTIRSRVFRARTELGDLLRETGSSAKSRLS